MRRSRRLLPLLVLLVTISLGFSLAYGWDTVLWQIDTAAQFEEGEPDQVVINSLGEVKLGSKLTRVALSDVALVWSILETTRGKLYLGTGNNGAVFRLEGTRAEEIAKLDCLVVTTLVEGDSGQVYAGTLPGGKVFRLEPGSGGPAKSKLLVDLEKADHVWALQYDTKRRVVFAATGPEGIVYSISAAGRAEVYYDSTEDHVLSLLLEEPGGDLLIGTSPKARLLRVTGPGRASALHDFDGTEVKGIARGSDDDLFMAVNTFATPRSSKISSTKTKVKTVGRPKPGKGKIFRRRADGSVEPLLQFNEGHLTSIAAPGDDLVYAGTGSKGRVIAVGNDRVSYVMMDVDERQVLALSLGGKRPIIVTGDAGAIYRVDKAVPGLAEYRSAPLDAGFISRWGRLEWRGEGQLVVQTRSGNTKEPDETWSDWSSAGPRPGSKVKSPSARYLQIRARWNRDSSAVLRALGVFHLPHNQRGVITSVLVDSPFRLSRPRSKSTVKTSGSTIRNGSSGVSPAKRSSVMKVSWSIDNPDSDRLRYRLYFREEAERVWRPILASDRVLTKTSYAWNTEAVPAGHYRVKVESSDELDHPDSQVMRHEKISPPIVVDNQPPRLLALKAKARRISGKAIDDFSPIAALEYSLDGRNWLPIAPSDSLLDSREESFAFDLPTSVETGPYVVAVKAHDRSLNATTGRATGTIE